MKKLNKLAVKAVSLVVAVMLLSSQSVFAWTHTDITENTTYSSPNAYYDNVSITGTGGAFNVNVSTATLKITGRNAHFIGNNAGYGGGAISNNGRVEIADRVEFRENQANLPGGAIYNTAGRTFIIGNGAEFRKNKSTGSYGGAINNDGTFEIGDGVLFKENQAKYNGGAIKNTGTFTIQDGAKFEGNQSDNFGGAIYNSSGGKINLIAVTNNIEFTGNTAKGLSNAIYIENGIVNLWSGNASIIFNDKIESEDNSSILNINGTILGYQEDLGTGIIVLNEDMSGYTGTVNFYGGTIELGEKGKWLGGKVNVVDVDNATINLANNFVQNHSFSTVQVSGNLNLSVDVDLENKQMDTISATKFEGAGKITVNKVKVIKDTKEKEVSITFADDKLKDKVEFSGNVETLKYKYSATYDDTTGAFTFVNEGGINMASAAGAVASSVGGYATQSMVINQAFAGIDRQMAQKVQPKSVAPQPTNKKDTKQNSKTKNLKSSNLPSNLYVSAGNQIFDDSATIERSLWLRPFALQETIKLNGVDIDNTLYGTLAGIDLPVGQDKQLSFYIGYAGSKQEFDEVKTNQTGYLVGVTGMLVKEKWYLGATVNGIFNKVSADSEDETNDFDMNMFTVGAKAGYNIDLSDKWILEPNITVMYGIANSDSYQTSLGSIDSQSTSNILVEPQVKAKWQLTNGWQPYGLLGYSANLSNKPKVKADGEELELDSIDGFVEYGIGVNKEFIGSVWSCYGQVTGRSGGRNGFGGNLGLKYKF